jgi:hypothetical protein
MLAGDLILPPGSPVLEPGHRPVEGLVLRDRRIVAVNEGVAIRKLPLSGRVKLIGDERVPSVRVEPVAIALLDVLHFEEKGVESR